MRLRALPAAAYEIKFITAYINISDATTVYLLSKALEQLLSFFFRRYMFKRQSNDRITFLHICAPENWHYIDMTKHLRTDSNSEEAYRVVLF